MVDHVYHHYLVILALFQYEVLQFYKKEKFILQTSKKYFVFDLPKRHMVE